jgi:hypothetical protein
MSGNPGTMRGTPGRSQGRGTVPFANSPGGGGSSNIPRPVHETAPAGGTSEVGTSSVSASRQKQSKRDEVRSVLSARCARSPSPATHLGPKS